MGTGCEAVLCPGCGGRTVEIQRATMPHDPPVDAEGAGAWYTEYGCTIIGAEPDVFCNYCGVAFDSHRSPPKALRGTFEGWKEVPFPAEPLYQGVSSQWERCADEGLHLVTTEEQLEGLLPRGVIHNRWWESASNIRQVPTWDDAVHRTAINLAAYALTSEFVGGIGMSTDSGGVVVGPHRQVCHLRSAFDPLGLLVIVDTEKVDWVLPKGGVLDDALLEFEVSPIATSGIHASHTKNTAEPRDTPQPSSPFDESASIEERITELLSSMDTDEGPPPEFASVIVVWGFDARSGTAVFLLEERAQFLGKCWRALDEHDTWDELLASGRDLAVFFRDRFQFDLYTGILAESEERVSPQDAAISFLRDDWLNPRSITRPLLNSDHEWGWVWNSLSTEGRRVLLESLHACELSEIEELDLLDRVRGIKGFEVPYYTCKEPEEVARRLRSVYVNCREDQELIDAASGRAVNLPIRPNDGGLE